MNTRITSTPGTQNPGSYRATSQSTQGAQRVPSETGEDARATQISPASSERLSVDQSDVTQHADYSFAEGAVQFPEAETKNPPTYAGLGEIMGGIAALFSGAPSGSFSPVIEQAQKNLAERRSPQTQEPVEVDTAASDKTLKD